MAAARPRRSPSPPSGDGLAALAAAAPAGRAGVRRRKPGRDGRRSRSARRRFGRRRPGGKAGVDSRRASASARHAWTARPAAGSSRAVARQQGQRDARAPGTAPRAPRRRSASIPARPAAGPPRSARARPPARRTGRPTSDGAAARRLASRSSGRPASMACQRAAAAPRSLSENDSKHEVGRRLAEIGRRCLVVERARLADEQVHQAADAAPAIAAVDGGAVEAGLADHHQPPCARLARRARRGRTAGGSGRRRPGPQPHRLAAHRGEALHAQHVVRFGDAARSRGHQRLGRRDLRQRHDEALEIVVLVRAVLGVVVRRPRRQIVLRRRAQAEQHGGVEPALAAPAPP